MKEENSELSDSVISREVEQEIFDILDGKIPDDFYEGLRQGKEGRLVPMEKVIQESSS